MVDPMLRLKGMLPAKEGSDSLLIAKISGIPIRVNGYLLLLIFLFAFDGNGNQGTANFLVNFVA